ncbi:MAG: hypothetical protein AAFO58_01375 [Pseudomonadota bacterium]
MIRPALTALALAGSLSACGFIDFETAEAVSDLSPLEADPSGVALFVDLPEGLSIQPGTAALAFGAARADTGQSDFVTYPLEELENEGLTGYRIAPSDLPRFRGQQMRLRIWEAEAPDATNGTFAVNAEPCTIGPGPAPQATASVMIQFQEGEALRPLIEDAPISRVFNAADVAAMPAC